MIGGGRCPMVYGGSISSSSSIARHSGPDLPDPIGTLQTPVESGSTPRGERNANGHDRGIKDRYPAAGPATRALIGPWR